jgi:hypothetical protein
MPGLFLQSSKKSESHGIHANTIRLWKDRYGGLDTSCLVRLKQLEDENRRKDRIIARLALEVDAMKELVEKNGWGPRSGKKRRALEARGISTVRAYQLAGYNRSNLYYRRRQHDDPKPNARMHELAQERPHWVIAHCERWQSDAVVIEEAAFGSRLLGDLRATTSLSVIAADPFKRGKEERGGKDNSPLRIGAGTITAADALEGRFRPRVGGLSGSFHRSNGCVRLGPPLCPQAAIRAA